MLYASDFSDEEGLSDDPDYYDFKVKKNIFITGV
jgi:hypothetical protein